VREEKRRNKDDGYIKIEREREREREKERKREHKRKASKQRRIFFRRSLTKAIAWENCFNRSP